MTRHGTAAPRLLAINNYFYRRGGAEAVFLDHIALFEARGWQAVPFSMQHPSNLPSPYAEYFISEIEYGRQTGALTKLRHAADVIYSREARERLGRLVDAARPHIAHAHNIYHHISPAILPLLRERGIPVVMTAHDLKLACPSYKMLSNGRVCERCKGGRIHNVVVHRCVKDSAAVSAVVFAETLLHRTLGLYRRNLDRIVVPSRFYKTKLVEWGWPAERIVHIPNFVDAESFDTDHEEDGYFVFAGRLAPEKGLYTLVEAAALSRQRLVIAGTGPEEEALKQRVERLGADVTFTGHLSGQALHRLIGRSLALVLPSEWYENAPVSVLEAYALGRPVIGAAIGGIPELIVEGETGFTAMSGDAEDLAARFVAMAGLAPQERRRMGLAGRAWAIAEFSAGAYAERTAALYADLGVA